MTRSMLDENLAHMNGESSDGKPPADEPRFCRVKLQLVTIFTVVSLRVSAHVSIRLLPHLLPHQASRERTRVGLRDHAR